MPDVEILSAEDAARAHLGLSLSTPALKRAYEAKIRDKWAALGWLNMEDAKTDSAKRFSEKMKFTKLGSEHDQLTMALLLDNQHMHQKVTERFLPITQDASGRQGITITQDTTTADEVLPTRDVMPIIRRIYSLVQLNKISRVQPMAGPSTYVFWLDFIRETDSTNLLSVEYNYWLTPELGVPPKGKMRLSSRQINAVKQMLGVTWSSEAEEDARALLGLDVESELMKAFGQEFVRDLFARHLTSIMNAATGANDPSIGVNLPGVWGNHLPVVTIPVKGGSQSAADYKATIYSNLLTAEAAFLRANRAPADFLMAGYGAAAFLQNLNTATGAEIPDRGDLSSVGISNYGTYAGRWQVQGTEFLPDNAVLMFSANPDALMAGHVYAPYIPVTASQKVYADYDPTTGNFQNKDAWTRTIRERSAEVVVKPYAFQLIYVPTTPQF